MLIVLDALGRTRTYYSPRRPGPRSSLQAPRRYAPGSRSSHTRNDDHRIHASPIYDAPAHAPPIRATTKHTRALRMPLRDPPAPPTSATAQSAPPALHVSMSLRHLRCTVPFQDSPSGLGATTMARRQEADSHPSHHRLPMYMPLFHHQIHCILLTPRNSPYVAFFYSRRNAPRTLLHVFRRRGSSRV
ncbi:hypothetical protein C8J57DRAFT_1665645 [Mycena rebaudengoi]|nr:hypothetical protein C8J57DRAFT_1665645 [Mycena rebaudengoi]